MGGDCNGDDVGGLNWLGLMSLIVRVSPALDNYRGDEPHRRRSERTDAKYAAGPIRLEKNRQKSDAVQRLHAFDPRGSTMPMNWHRRALSVWDSPWKHSLKQRRYLARLSLERASRALWTAKRR